MADPCMVSVVIIWRNRKRATFLHQAGLRQQSRDGDCSHPA